MQVSKSGEKKVVFLDQQNITGKCYNQENTQRWRFIEYVKMEPQYLNKHQQII